jgi:hypothetical protein
MAKSETEVVKKDAEATAVAAMQQQFAEDANAGFEEAGASAYAIPFLQVLQSGSPQCKKSDGAYIKGAEEGMFYNTVTQEIFSGEDGIVVIPCHYTQRFVEWKTRESGGGFVAEHLPSDDIVNTTSKDDKGRDMLPNGNVLVDTRNHYVLIVGQDGMLSPALIALSSTASKVSRQWMSKMQGIKIKNAAGVFVTAPMSSRKYKITTVPKSNDKGSWFVPNVELIGIVEDVAEYNAAMDFRNAVRSGTAQVKHEQAEDQSSDHDNAAF